MPLVTCPECKGRNPASAVSCVHCGHRAEPCSDCHGTGECSLCEGVVAPGFAPCSGCKGTLKCASCQGNKVRWLNST
jgi:hypothetical protein